MPRFQIALLAAILFLGLQSATMPTIISAGEQETPRRHSLIHRSTNEPAVLPATTQGTILQPPGAEPTQIASSVWSPKNSASLPTVPSTHHRALTKRPAVVSIIDPTTSSQTLLAAPTSGIAAGQVTQTTVDPTKDTTAATTAPITKATVVPLPGVTSAGSAAVASTSPSPFTGTASVRSTASAGSGSSPSSSSSRSALNLLQNSAIANLLQPSTAGVSTPPPPPPPSTSPSTTPPPSPSTESAILTWAANTEPDLAGYKVYVGTASGTYSFPGSAFVTGKVTSYTVSNLPKGQTYFFAITAYDSAGNESPFSAEVSKSLY